MPRVLKVIGNILIAVSIFVIPVSFLAGNPAVLAAGFGGLFGGALMMGLARVVALLEQIADNTRSR